MYIEKMAASWKYFEYQIYYLIHLLNGERVGVAVGVGKRNWISVTKGMGKVGGRRFFYPFRLFVIYSLTKKMLQKKKKKKKNKKRKEICQIL